MNMIVAKLPCYLPDYLFTDEYCICLLLHIGELINAFVLANYSPVLVNKCPLLVVAVWRQLTLFVK